MEEPIFIVALIATFILAGAVKGVIGLGLPTVVLGLMTCVCPGHLHCSGC